MDPFPDVMRGEETALIGQIAAGVADGLFILSGTHSKWVRVESGSIIIFQTCMTGEALAVLHRHSIFGRAGLWAGRIHPRRGFRGAGGGEQAC